MKDKTVLEVSEPLRQYIEALAEDEILHGGAYQEQKKYLEHYCQTEGIDYSTLDSALASLFKAAADFKTTGSASSELLVNQLGQRCFLSDDTINELLSSLRNLRSQEDAKRKKKEQAAARRKANTNSKAAENRKLLRSDKLFDAYPAVRNELLSFVNNNIFNSEYLKYQSLLIKLEETCIKISKSQQGLDLKNSDHQAYRNAITSFLEKRNNLHCSELNSAYHEGLQLLDRGNQLREKQERFNRIMSTLLYLCIAALITRWIFSPTSIIESLWVRWAIEIVVILFFLYKLYGLYFNSRE